MTPAAAVDRLFEAHLVVADLDVSLAFYRDRLGLELAHVIPHGGAGHGCATELAPRDQEVRIVATTLRAHAQFYQSLLDQAKEQGALPKAMGTQTTASALLGLVLGMRVCARGGASAETLQVLRHQAEAFIA